MKYRKKPVVIEAFRLVEDRRLLPHNLDHYMTLVEAAKYICLAEKDAYSARIETTNAGDLLFIKTLEGAMAAGVGDWIIKGVQGEFYPCKNDIFEATYEEVRN